MGQSRGLPRREKRLERGDYRALGWSVAVFAALMHQPEMSADKLSQDEAGWLRAFWGASRPRLLALGRQVQGELWPRANVRREGKDHPLNIVF